MYGSEDVNKNMQLSLKAGLCVMMEWQGNIVLENGQLNDKVHFKKRTFIYRNEWKSDRKILYHSY